MTNEMKISIIRNATPELHNLAMLAEECAELSQAALKLIRAKGYGVQTDKTEAGCYDTLLHEWADVYSIMQLLVPPGGFTEMLVNAYLDEDYDQMLRRVKGGVT